MIPVLPRLRRRSLLLTFTAVLAVAACSGDHTSDLSAPKVDEKDPTAAAGSVSDDTAEVETDVDLALFAADHRPGDDAVDLAQRAFEAHPGIYGHDALAWGHLTAGNIDAPREHGEAALATGTRDPLFRFHAASIASAAGDTEAARRHLRVVLTGNRRFSPLHLEAVTDLAAALGLDVPPSPP